MKVTTAVKDLGIIKGATGPHIMECDDGNSYVVKFAGPTRAAINEFVGWSLAREADLPILEASFIQVPEDLMTTSRDLSERRIPPGLHMGTVLIPRVLDYGQFLLQHPGGRLVNADMLPGTVCHDNWILTYDREREDNHLVDTTDGSFRYVMIDFTHAYTGDRWTADSIEQGSYGRSLMPVFPPIGSTVLGMDSFEPTLSLIEGMSDGDLMEVVESIPSSWGLTEDDSDCLLDFLVVRRGLVRGILASNRAAFPNWKD
jgi:hypothetical protein